MSYEAAPRRFQAERLCVAVRRGERNESKGFACRPANAFEAALPVLIPPAPTPAQGELVE